MLKFVKKTRSNDPNAMKSYLSIYTLYLYCNIIKVDKTIITKSHFIIFQSTCSTTLH